ncbi:MAG: response regulator [Magnetococcales bacterium]|nr:response regulator [Magnetococcales bacterium]MBF0151373.1 response regulator [Magnetococcales bacterium]MBF0174255.1 response regulator [Magnetococcales bacterium]MBF0348045.1 response regulator [Magnetococcales bacterium]MBF0632362.1 response regulator [Magnetococcales bacterium]
MATVLVVDDDLLIRLFLKELLQQDGHRTLMAENGLEALARMEEEPCDLVLMDIHMPVMDGYQTTQRIKAGGSKANFIPVIFLTSAQSDLERARCLECGGDDFINKPPNPTILIARIQSWLQRAKLANLSTRTVGM